MSRKLSNSLGLTLSMMSSEPTDSPTDAAPTATATSTESNNPNGIEYPEIRGLNPNAFPYLSSRLGYRAERIVGEGRYGTVVFAQKVNPEKPEDPPVEYAIKVVVPEEIALRAERPLQDPREVVYSTYILNKNCVRVYDIVKMFGVHLIIMDFCRNGNLAEYLKKNKAPLEPKLLRTWAREIGAGILYLHSDLELVHRDLKLDNVLLDENNHTKIADFGTVKCLYRSAGQMNHTRCGTLAYMPPELLKGNLDFCTYDPFKTDIWCFGVMLFTLCARRFPFGIRGIQIVPGQSVIYDLIRTKVSDRHGKVRSTLDKSLQIFVEKRSTIEQLLLLPLFIRADLDQGLFEAA